MRQATTSAIRRGLSSSSAIQRSRSAVHVPHKLGRLRGRDAPVKRPAEHDSASRDAWDSAVGILKRSNGGNGGGINSYSPLQGGLRMALLIDAENITYKNVDGIMNEVEKLGIVQIRRIYADWTSEIMRGWRQTVLTNALTPVHQFQSSTGKGNTDSMMIIDAMDILYKNKDIESFCIVSSDADFTRLATKLREEGRLVLGIGSNLTPAPFVVACNRFVYLHNLTKEDTPQTSQAPIQQQTNLRAAGVAAPVPLQPKQAWSKPAVGKPITAAAAVQPASSTPAPASKLKAKLDLTVAKPPKAAPLAKGEKAAVNQEAIRGLLPLLTRAWVSYRADNGWAPLMGVNQEIERIQPGFSIQNFGPFENLEDLLEATEVFEVKKQKQDLPSTFMVRRVVSLKEQPAAASAQL